MAEDAVQLAADKLDITLKDKQREAILAFLSGRDVFVALPTGYGKSYIYGILPLCFDALKSMFIII